MTSAAVTTESQPLPQYEARAWLVTLPNGYWSVHLEQASATQYAARNRGVCEPLFRRLPAPGAGRAA